MKIQSASNFIKSTAGRIQTKLPSKEAVGRFASHVQNNFSQSKDAFIKTAKEKKAITGCSFALGLAIGLFAVAAAAIRKLESKFFHIKEKFKDMNFGIDEKAENELEGLNEITLKTKSGGEIKVWDINPDNSKTYAVCCLGFGCPKNHPQAEESYKELVKNGYGVIAFDYLGWGESTGDELTEKNTKESVDTVFKYLHKKGIQNENINLIGHSLGCGVAAGYAKNHKVQSLVLVNPFNRLKDMVSVWADRIEVPNGVRKCLKTAPADALPLKNKYNNVSALKQVSCPTLIVHSADDATIPVEIAHKLYQKTEDNGNIHYQEFETGAHELSEEKVSAVLDFLLTAA